MMKFFLFLMTLTNLVLINLLFANLALAKTGLCSSAIQSINDDYQKISDVDTCDLKTKSIQTKIIDTKIIEVRIHLAQDQCQFVQDAKWLKWQIDQSNQLFGKIGICFKMKTILVLGKEWIEMKDQKMRTALGQNRLKSGLIDVFVVGRLADIDIKGEEIRGVHWRNPKDRQKQRWIILSKIAKDFVLAHELGHYFDLPHSTYETSIMNKTPRDYPIAKRGFVEDEYQIMQKAKERMLDDLHLIPIAQKPLQQ
jgi:hypothetical protein